MNPGLRSKLEALGAELSPPMLQGTSALMASIAAPRDESVEITRDHRYGPDARNRLDLFRRGAPAGAPVLVYVHGGGFVMGDKTTPGSPFYDNVGQWAARQGYVGVTMTYKLAPQNRWPSGPEDIARAVHWLRENVAAHGGDPAKIFLMGQSAGAVHVASYLSHPRFFTGGDSGLAGAILVSGIFDPSVQPPNPYRTNYYGDDDAALADARCIDGLVESPVPQLYTVSEFDPREFQDQAQRLALSWFMAKGTYAPMEWLAGHNHLSPAQAIGSTADDLGPRLAAFVATVTAR